MGMRVSAILEAAASRGPHQAGLAVGRVFADIGLNLRCLDSKPCTRPLRPDDTLVLEVSFKSVLLHLSPSSPLPSPLPPPSSLPGQRVGSACRYQLALRDAPGRGSGRNQRLPAAAITKSSAPGSGAATVPMNCPFYSIRDRKMP